MTQFIGLSGYARAGKDTAAAALVKHLGFVRISFADKLKQAIRELDPYITSAEDEFLMLRISDLWDVSLSDAQNWEALKVHDEVRRLLQYMGTEVGRKLFGANFWVEQAFASVPHDASGVVFSDCRFPQEAQAVTSRGGEVWRIDRPGYGPVNNHPSETSLDHWPFDHLINNDRDQQTLEHEVVWLADPLYEFPTPRQELPV